MRDNESEMTENSRAGIRAAGPRGRPRVQETADEIVASVLATAGPRVSTPEYSTRSIAELTGLSQSLVSRAIRRIRSPGTQEDGAPGDGAKKPETPWTGAQRDAPSGETDGTSGEDPASGGSAELRLVHVAVRFPRIRLEFSAAGAAETGHAGRTGGSARPTAFARRAAALMAALWVSGAAEWPAPEAPAQEKRAGAVETHEESRPVPTVPARNSVAEWSPGQRPWQEFLREVSTLLSRCAPTEDAIPGDLLAQLAARAGRGLHGVSWARADTGGTAAAKPGLPKTHCTSDSDQLSVAEYPAPGRSPSNRWLPRVELSATEQIAVALRKEMTTSGFRAGDRLPVRTMAEALGLPQTTVRTAMRQLADDGLLVHAPGGFRVPSVTGADVIDLYAARLHLGMVILRACAAQSRHRLLPARLALRRLEAAAARGAHADVGEADLRFQQELAEASGLAQSSRSFHALTLRLRMFISVLRLDYSPAVDRLASDGRRLLAALVESQAEEAVQIWRGKLDHAVRHMSALSPDTFDAGLWARLSR